MAEDDVRSAAERLLRRVSMVTSKKVMSRNSLAQSIRALQEAHENMSDKGTVDEIDEVEEEEAETPAPTGGLPAVGRAHNTQITDVSPSIPSTGGDLHHGHKWTEGSWQMKMFEFLSSNAFQMFLIFLLLVDVLVLFADLAITSIHPPCSVIIDSAVSCCTAGDESHGLHAEEVVLRILKDGGDACPDSLIETRNQVGCEENSESLATQNILFWSTIAILLIFEIELILSVYLVGVGSFCRQARYVVDLVVVTASLALELSFYFTSSSFQTLPGILVIFRVCRFLRVGHAGSEQNMLVAMKHMEELEERLKYHEGELPLRPQHLREMKT